MAVLTASPPATPPTTAPPGDVVHVFSASPAFGTDGLCLSARESGLWCSWDDAVTWRPAAPEPGNGAATSTAIAFSPRFAADRTVFAGGHGAVFRSLDGGRRWRAMALPSPPPLVTCLVVPPAFEADGALLAGTLEDGVLRSTDRGETWRRSNFGLLDPAVLALAVSPDVHPDDALVAGTETGVSISRNGGRSWRETSFPEDAAPVLALAVSRTFAADGVLWAGTERAGVWRSADRGESWQRVDRGAIVEPVDALLLPPPPDAAAVVLAISPTSAAISRDRGRRWTAALAAPPDHGGIASVALLSGAAIGAPLLVALRDGAVVRAVLEA